MTLALYIIGSTAALIVVSARLREAREELARVRAEHDAADQAARDERAAYAHGVAMTLACLLTGLAAATWYAPRRPSARPAPAGRTGASAEASADGKAAR